MGLANHLCYRLHLIIIFKHIVWSGRDDTAFSKEILGALNLDNRSSGAKEYQTFSVDSLPTFSR